MMEEGEEQKIAAMKKILFLRLLDDKARSRLNNIRVANPPFASQLEELLLMYAQKTGGRRIDEQTLVKIARAARGEKSEGTITRM